MAVKPIGTGPYKVVSLDPGVEVTLERFDGYYKGGQRGNASIGKLHFRVLPEVNTQYAELINGTVDWIWKVLKDDAPRLASRSNIKIETKPVTRFDYIAMDIHVPNTPVADVRVRQAINYAVNRKEIRDAFKGEGAPLIKSACNPVQFGCETDVTDYMYDPEKAKQLLKDAGFESGLNLSMIVSPDGVAVGQAIKDNLAAVGINLTLSTLNIRQRSSNGAVINKTFSLRIGDHTVSATWP